MEEGEWQRLNQDEETPTQNLVICQALHSSVSPLHLNRKRQVFRNDIGREMSMTKHESGAAETVSKESF